VAGAVSEGVRALKGDRQVPVTEREPDVLSERAQAVHHRERVVGQAPAAFVDPVGEPERDQVGIGGDVAAVDLDVVAGVGDHDEFVTDDIEHASRKLRAAGSAGENDDGSGGGGHRR
jgi:hypothetical protein